MSLNKKKHNNENEAMKESDEDFSGEEDSDEGEGISAENEVNFYCFQNTQENQNIFNFCRKFKLILRVATQLTAT